MSQATEQIASQFANGSVNRNTWGGIIYNVKVYGAKGDGIADDTAKILSAVNAAAVSGGVVFFAPGTYRIATNFTVPENVTLWLANGAKLSVDSGFTVTINGPLEAGLYQIFSGIGLIRGKVRVGRFFPQWWGTVSGADAQPGIQKAIDHIQASGQWGGVLEIPCGDYGISSTITIKHGTGYAQVRMYGNNSQFYFTGTGACIQILPTDVQGGAGYGVSHFEIHDINMNTSTLSGSYGIDIGASGYILDDFAYSLVSNIIMQNFDTGIRVTEARHISFRNVVVRTPKTKGLLVQTFGRFCGDHNIFNCEFASGSHSAVHLYAYNGVNNTDAEVRGNHFTDCVIYGTSAATATVFIEGSGYGRIFDLWFTSCALDFGNNYAFYVDNQQIAQMGGFHLVDMYATNFTYFLYMVNNSSLSVYGITVRGAQGFVGTPFNIVNIQQVSIIDCMFTGVTGKSTFSSACKNVKLSGNTFDGNKLAGQCVQLASGVLSAIVKNNFGNYANGSTFAENLTGLTASAVLIADNLQTV